MKSLRFISILFLVAFSLVACTTTKDNATNNNETSPDSEIELNDTTYEPEDDSLLFERPLAEEFADLHEITATIERYFAFINSYENSDPNDTEAGVLAVLDIIAANQYDINTSLPTMISYFNFINVENFSLTNMSKLNNNLYLIKGIQTVREEFIPGEVNYNKLVFNPYIFKEDEQFKIALTKDRIPEDLYDNFADIEENYDPLMRWDPS